LFGERREFHVAVREHLAAWVEQHEPPSFVARALRRFLDCGILARGFVRVRCDACKGENLVATVTCVPDAVPGSITLPKHFGSTLNLHIHFHLLALDGIGDVDRLLHYQRDLFELLRNFVNFTGFYDPRSPAIFQVGTLYLGYFTPPAPATKTAGAGN
jgi:hypothetical protein